MKKLLLPICAVLMCMTSCQKDGNDILTLVMEDYSSDAKLHLDNDNYTVWDGGDYIWLNGSQEQVSVDGTTATINTNMDNRAFTAIYPYDWARGGSRELWAPEGAEESWVPEGAEALDMTGVEYPSTQRYEELSSGIQKVVAPMAGTCSAQESTLKFHNLGCILAVKVTNNTGATMNVKKIEVIADGAGTYLCGKYNILFGLYSIFHVSGGNNKVTLDCGFEGVSVANGSNKTFYIAVPPVTAKLTVKVYDDYYYYDREQTNALQLLRSHGYNAGITANDEGKKQYAPLNNQIMYTTTDGQPLDRTWITHPEYSTRNSIFDGRGYSFGEDYEVDGNWFLTRTNGDFTTFPENSFRNNTQLTSITLPNSVTSIGTFVFNKCRNLATVYLGSGINFIDGSSFSECDNLMNVYCTSSSTSFNHNEWDLIDYIFVGVPATATLHLPSVIETAAYNAWKEAWWFNGFNEEEWITITIERPILTDL